MAQGGQHPEPPAGSSARRHSSTLAHPRARDRHALHGDCRKHRDRRDGAVDRPRGGDSIRTGHVAAASHLREHPAPAAARGPRRSAPRRCRRTRVPPPRCCATRLGDALAVVPREAPAAQSACGGSVRAGRAAARRPRRGRRAAERLVVDLRVAVAGRRRASGMSGSSGVIGVSVTPARLPAAPPAHPTRCSTSGTATEPSSRWPFSSSAISVRATATAVPLSVATWRGPPVRPAVADVEPARLEVGRVRGRGELAVALLARQPRLAVVLLGGRGAEVVDRDVDDAVRDLERLQDLLLDARAAARARRRASSGSTNAEHLDLVELVHAEDAARVARPPRPPRAGSRARSRRSAAAAARRRASRPRAARRARPRSCRVR